MSIVLNGLDLADNEPYWWGWGIPGPGRAAGYVDPAARQDFFDELAVASQSPAGQLTDGIGRRGRFAYDTATGSGWHAAGSRSSSVWTYRGSDPAMSLYICCVHSFRGPVCTYLPAYMTGFDSHNQAAQWVVGSATDGGAPGGHNADGNNKYMVVASAGSNINQWGVFTANGSFTGGASYTVGFWYQNRLGGSVTALAQFGLRTALWPPATAFAADHASRVLPYTGNVWTYAELNWVPDTTYASDGNWNTTTGVAFGIDGTTSSGGGGVYLDDGTLEACS